MWNQKYNGISWLLVFRSDTLIFQDEYQTLLLIWTNAPNSQYTFHAIHIAVGSKSHYMHFNVDSISFIQIWFTTLLYIF